MTKLYVIGSGLEVPGLEAVMEYGDSGSVLHGEIPGALKINDKEDLTRVRLSQIDGLHDDPDGRDSRSPTAGRHGERAGQMVYGGRTVGLTGKVEAGSIPAMRDLWRRFRSTFGVAERDLVIHVPDEAPFWTNELPNPSLDLDTSGWSVQSAGTVTGPSINNTAAPQNVGQAQVVVTVATPSNFLTVTSKKWQGEDVYLRARIRIATLTSGTIASLSIGVVDSATSGITSSNFASQVSPATGTWYTVSTRVPASALRGFRGNVGLAVRSTSVGAANYVVQWDKCMLVLLDQDEPSPTGYFDGDTPGYEWGGAPYTSASSGPHYAVNMVEDPSFEEITTPSVDLNSWISIPATGVTISTPPQRALSYKGKSGTALYALFTKDANSTSRNFSIVPVTRIGYNGISMFVESGRRYRWSASVDNLAAPITGSIYASITWTDAAGGTISVSRSAPMEETEERLSVNAIAPAGVWGAVVSIDLIGTITLSGEWEVYITDPCFIDISDFVTEDFYGVGDPELESSPVVDAAVRELARRRIPRPFVLRNVRKTSDSKAPERQANLRATRDFTMSLRAADPRIYVLGDRRSALQMTGSPETVALSGAAGFTLDTPGPPARSGFTYEGHYITHPGVGAPYTWSHRASAFPTTIYYNPNEGVGFKAYGNEGGGDSYGNNRPAQDIRTRMYRTAEGYTYANPRVILGGAPGSSFGARSGDPHSMVRSDVSLGGGITKDTASLSFNALTLLLKRVAAGTWLELRWNSWTYAELLATGYGANPQAVYAFELWCSHNTSGTPAATRLGAWDYSTYDSSTPYYPFSRLTDPMWLTSWMENNTVHWELWSNYPTSVGTVGRLEARSYALPAPLQPVIGSTVEARPGWSIDIERSTSDLQFEVISYTSPFIHYYEQSDVDFPAKSITVPVIGSIDTPEKIELRGDIVDPIVSITVPAFEDKPAKTTTAHFQGSISNANPVTIDLAKGTVQDSFGQNQYGMLTTGSSFTTLRPGNNVITLRAGSWGAYPAHLLVSWSDALA